MTLYALRRRFSRLPWLFAPSFLFVLLAAQPAAAQWPTTEWRVLSPEDAAGYNWFGEIEHMADSAVEVIGIDDAMDTYTKKHTRILESASRWYEGLGFEAPYVFTPDGNLFVGKGEPYVAVLKDDAKTTVSTTYPSGLMKLTRNEDFLSTNTQYWSLMVASAVHELFHAIHNANDSYRAYIKANANNPATVLPGCADADKLEWLVEGMASAVQIQWREQERGYEWGHPFKGSPHPAWVRYFDQPLHAPSIPPGLRQSENPGEATLEQFADWRCGYGTWYFWYAVGEMLGRTPAQQVSYLRYIIERSGPWDNGALKVVDAGLRAAADAFGTPRVYSSGLYSLYPQFVAQYLNDDQFYQHLRVVDLGTPALVEWKSKPANASYVSRPPPSKPLTAPLKPLASRAWRIRIHLPENVSAASSAPNEHLVRFTLDAQPGTDREQLHLIVNEWLVGRPALPKTPYAYSDVVEADGDRVVEYLVRVANVAKQAAKTKPAAFMLRVEVEGFYAKQALNDTSNDNLAGRIASTQPPSITVHGPGPFSCSASPDSQAIFSLETPDEIAAQRKRAMPETMQFMKNMFGKSSVLMDKASRQGMSDKKRARIEAKMKRARDLMEAGMQEARAERNTAALVAEAKAKRFTKLAATFVGTNNGEECQVTLHATLRGRQGRPQTLHVADETEKPGFKIEFFPSETLKWMSQPLSRHEPDYRTEEGGYWELCAMTEKEQQKAKGAGQCPTVLCSSGRLHLSAVKQDLIEGTFRIDALHWPEPPDSYEEWSQCYLPDDRGTVTGHFYVAAGDEGFDAAMPFSMMKALRGRMPGAPIRDFDPESMLKSSKNIKSKLKSMMKQKMRKATH